MPKAFQVAVVLLGTGLKANGDATCSSEQCLADKAATTDQVEEQSLLQLGRGGGEGRESADGQWYGKKPKKMLKAMVFKPLDEALASQAVTFGAAISGGGNRAMTYDIGVFRALHAMNLTSKFEFVSSSSGGSWFAGLWTFAKGTDEANLGKTTKMSELNMQALNKKPASKFGQCVLGATNRRMMSAASRAALTGRMYDGWEMFVSDSYLKPFGLNKAAYLAEDEANVKRIKNANPSLKKANFMVPRTDRPQWGCMCMIFAPLKYTVDQWSVARFEITPKMTGVATDLNFTYHPGSWLNSGDHQGDLKRHMGGGYVETFAFGGDAPKDEVAKTTLTQLPAPSKPLTLAKAMAITSLSPAGAMAQTSSGQDMNPRVRYWPMSSDKNLDHEEALTFITGDGGNLENSAIVAQLARGATKVFSIIAGWAPLNLTYAWEDTCAEGSTTDFDPVEAGLIGTLISLYGYGEEVSDVPGGFFYEHNQVFHKNNTRSLGCEIWRLVSAGEPAVVRRSEEVLPNEWQHVKGGYTVDILFVYMAQFYNFEKGLPADTQAELAKGAEGAFANFPNYKTQGQNGKDMYLAFTAPQVNLLAAQGEHTIMMAKDKIQAFFTD